jgi:hypothetical protein
MANRVGSGQLGREHEQEELQGKEHDEQDLSEMLQELRILQQGVLVLTAFLTTIPFSPGFAKINQTERWVFLATFVCSMVSVVLFSAPAAQHRLARPLTDRVRFKDFATRMVIIGLVPFSLALVLASQLVVSEVLGFTESLVVAGVIGVLLIIVWWVLPLAHKRAEQT